MEISPVNRRPLDKCRSPREAEVARERLDQVVDRRAFTRSLGDLVKIDAVPFAEQFVDLVGGADIPLEFTAPRAPVFGAREAVSLDVVSATLHTERTPA